ncbi:SEC-C metal-binding domain-containing protein [Streptomyces sp. NPDC002688]|uniref:SEC-C metal-binding domain-containing protein n=1 Tax=Streptomyces sp. NPDC002688 TaxID=3154423 RepID=UPI003316C37D
MTTRQFLSDSELDRLMGSFADEGLPVGMRDQLGAASKEAEQIGRNLAAQAVAAGGRAFLGTPCHDTDRLRPMLRPRLRMVLAALGAGAALLCPHTQQVRPMLLVCDPPSLNCMDPVCQAVAVIERERLGIRWNHTCDACGRHVEMLTPHLLALGPLSISGHLCETCTRGVAASALAASDSTETVGRKSPCPCGSGRRFKRCHGSQHATA